jgi:crotonobetainyl-CoA:carnitine CoA-transferase CaiB-like acyl-CoA transferase
VLGIDLSGDERFASEYERFVHREELAAILQQRFDTHARDVWITRLREVGVPCGPVNSIDQVLADPQFAARNLFPQDPGRFGQERIVNTPLVSDGAPRARGKAPRTGADSSVLLGELGMDESEIAQLVQQGVIGIDESTPRLVS